MNPPLSQSTVHALYVCVITSHTSLACAHQHHTASQAQAELLARRWTAGPGHIAPANPFQVQQHSTNSSFADQHHPDEEQLDTSRDQLGPSRTASPKPRTGSPPKAGHASAQPQMPAMPRPKSASPGQRLPTAAGNVLRSSTGTLQLHYSMPAGGTRTGSILSSSGDNAPHVNRHGAGSMRAAGSILAPAPAAGAAAAAGRAEAEVLLRSSMQSLKLLASKSSSRASSRASSRRMSAAGGPLPAAYAAAGAQGSSSAAHARQATANAAPAVASLEDHAGANAGSQLSRRSTKQDCLTAAPESRAAQQDPAAASARERSCHSSLASSSTFGSIYRHTVRAGPAASAAQEDAAVLRRSSKSSLSSSSGSGSMHRPTNPFAQASTAAAPAPATQPVLHTSVPLEAVLVQDEAACSGPSTAHQHAAAAPVAASLTAERLSNILSYLDQVEQQVGPRAAPATRATLQVSCYTRDAGSHSHRLARQKLPCVGDAMLQSAAVL